MQALLDMNLGGGAAKTVAGVALGLVGLLIMVVVKLISPFGGAATEHAR